MGPLDLQRLGFLCVANSSQTGVSLHPISCFLAAASMTNGIVTVAPKRLKTNEGTLIGSGQLDLRRDTMDLLIQSEGRTTDFWALDNPLGVSGSFTNPRAQPSAGSGHPGVAPTGRSWLLTERPEPVRYRSLNTVIPAHAGTSC